MLFGIVAVIAAVLNGQGGFYEAVMKLAEIESDVPLTMGQKGVFASFFGPDLPNLMGGGSDSDLAWNMGTSADGT